MATASTPPARVPTPRKTAALLALLLLAASTLALAYVYVPTRAVAGPPLPTPLLRNDSVGSVKAFRAVYQVLLSPRCMNCHPAGEVPLQGEDSHLHPMGVRRGVDGHGISALKCANCHQDQNLPGPHLPPGNPKWGLPPTRTKMVFQGRTPRQLARQLLDLTQNGGKTRAQLIEHVTSDPLVLAGWHPGEGRALPPLSHAAFARAFTTWIATGGYAPGP